MAKKYNTSVLPSMTVHPGDLFEIPLTGTRTIARIEQLEFDKFELTFAEVKNADSATPDADSAVTVSTHGYDRLTEPEPDCSTGTPRRRLIENADSLDLKVHDTLSVPGFGNALIGYILKVRANRYQIRLDVKFVASFYIEILVTN